VWTPGLPLENFYSRIVTDTTRVLLADDAAAAAPALLRLLRELTPSAAALTAELVADRVRSDRLRVVVAERDGELLGAATLCLYPTLTSGLVGHVEDVIVTESARGQRVSVGLMEELHEEAARLGCSYLQLTSRASREAANRLYQSLGYARRETNVYRMRLPLT
jgi:GNAT superfamily N-acetyltransferase